MGLPAVNVFPTEVVVTDAIVGVCSKKMKKKDGINNNANDRDEGRNIAT